MGRLEGKKQKLKGKGEVEGGRKKGKVKGGMLKKRARKPRARCSGQR